MRVEGGRAMIEAQQKLVGLDDDYPSGTLCWLETPVNPYGEVRDIAKCALTRFLDLYELCSCPPLCGSRCAANV